MTKVGQAGSRGGGISENCMSTSTHPPAPMKLLSTRQSIKYESENARGKAGVLDSNHIMEELIYLCEKLHVIPQVTGNHRRVSKRNDTPRFGC